LFGDTRPGKFQAFNAAHATPDVAAPGRRIQRVEFTLSRLKIRSFSALGRQAGGQPEAGIAALVLV
jgi:hypothetical protein